MKTSPVSNNEGCNRAEVHLDNALEGGCHVGEVCNTPTYQEGFPAAVRIRSRTAHDNWR